jgi:hypothetical protein
MARYVVHIRGEGPEALNGALFLREQVAWLALVFGPFWFLAKGAWIVALLITAGMLIAGWGVAFSGLSPLFGIALQLLMGLFLALEANALRAWELSLKGYRDVALLIGDDQEEVERRFFAEALGSSAANPAVMPHPLPPRPGPVPVIGLFPSRSGGSG